MPVAYTSGFSPRPKLSFGLALPTGCESLAEYLDVELAAPMPAAEISTRLEGQFPKGIGITAGSELEAGGGSLQQDVTSCTWEIEVPDVDSATLESIVGAAIAATNLPLRRERKGREEEDDLRPALRDLAVVANFGRTMRAQSRAGDTSPRCAPFRARAGSRNRARPYSQDSSVDRKRRLAHRASRAGRSSAASGLGACVVTSSRRELPNVRHPSRQRGERTIGTAGPGI